jgi:myo-inositol-1(or 4)-monophosphatase
MNVTSDDIQERYDFAIALAVEAGQLAARSRQALGPATSKSAIDFCTEADVAVERLIRERITARFGDPMIGEEDGGEAADNVWVVDPIDGTTGYIHGTRRWCVSIAYVHQGRITLGVIYAPLDDQLFAARLGHGAFMNGRRIEVSHIAHGTAPVIEVGWSQRRPLSAFCGLLHRLVGADMEFRRHGSGALGLADVALGLNDGYVELHINSWDCLAGILLVREAGGTTNDFLANDGLQQGNPIIAATPEIYDRLMALAGES